MRDYLILTVVILGALWAFDRYKFEGHYTADVWQQTTNAGRDFSRTVQDAVDRAMSGRRSPGPFILNPINCFVLRIVMSLSNDHVKRVQCSMYLARCGISICRAPDRESASIGNDRRCAAADRSRNCRLFVGNGVWPAVGRPGSSAPPFLNQATRAVLQTQFILRPIVPPLALRFHCEPGHNSDKFCSGSRTGATSSTDYSHASVGSLGTKGTSLVVGWGPLLCVQTALQKRTPSVVGSGRRSRYLTLGFLTGAAGGVGGWGAVRLA